MLRRSWRPCEFGMKETIVCMVTYASHVRVQSANVECFLRRMVALVMGYLS